MATPPVRMTVPEAAKKWGCSPSLIHKLIAQKRVSFERVGSGDKRATLILITQANKPPEAEELTPAQRKAWPRSKPKTAAASQPARR